MSLPLDTAEPVEQLLATSTGTPMGAWEEVLFGGAGAAGDCARPGFLGGMGGGFPLSALGMVGDLMPGDNGLSGLETLPGLGE